MIRERLELSTDRIKEIIDAGIPEKVQYEGFFRDEAEYLILLFKVNSMAGNNELCKLNINEAKDLNKRLYKDILAENYDTSYGNPEYMKELSGKYDCDPKISQYLCFLYAQIRALIPYAWENREEILVMYSELFIQIYDIFAYAASDRVKPDVKEIHDALYWFERDNLDILVRERILDRLSPERSFARDIIMNADLTDTSYLYDFGEYITDNETGTARFLARFTDDEIEAMASTFTEGYRVGFVKAGKPLDKKKTVNIRYCLGFERIVREAVKQFEKMGLQSVIYRADLLAGNKSSQTRTGYFGAIPNRQYDYDHREDFALFLDSEYVKRKTDLMRSVYEENKELANTHAGPAVIEIFGEDPFTPVNHESAIKLSKSARELFVSYTDQAGRLANEYIIGEERSFTIIAYPIPEIGPDYEKIFMETVKINTLDYKLYEKMQQMIIDELDKAERVHIVGNRDTGNETDLVVELCKLTDPEHQTIFENCVADVNIPVGEVFTSPVLKGTNGLLHVTGVYLDGLKYEDLHVWFKDGMISDYSCKNFDDDEENRKFIEENLLFHHKTLPMGEFAIGTNTTAYRMSRDYDIGARLPILIGEKTGPHFAVGDTCYSHEEQVTLYNLDGKEIVAKSNEVADKRDTDPAAAYFYCHTDITIPYDELKLIEAVHKDGSRTDIIRDGIFVLEGLDELNEPLLRKE
ncbi:MAG: aminopeptidase [Lachnospiraceae bacterium]|nr:aminopeptidase [Lachnospiraceae bacterium]